MRGGSFLPDRDWVAVKALSLSYYIGGTILITFYTHYGNPKPIMVTYFKFLNSNPGDALPSVAEELLGPYPRVSGLGFRI